MGGWCKGICVQYKTGKNPDGSRYGNGKKRCSVCDIFIEYSDLYCPCCGFKLKTLSRNKQSKARIRARREK